MKNFLEELQDLINRFSKENESNTPDFILAQYMENCLDCFTKASNERERWYGKNDCAGCTHIEENKGSFPSSAEIDY